MVERVSRVTAFLIAIAVTATACTATADGDGLATEPPVSGQAEEESEDVSPEPRDPSDTSPAPPVTSPTPPVTSPTTPAGGLRALLDDITVELLLHDPELVTELGSAALLGMYNDTLNATSNEKRAARAALAAASGGRLDIAATGLSPSEEISVDALRWYLSHIVVLGRFLEHDYPVNFITGLHTNFPEFMADVHPMATPRDVDDDLARLRAIGPELGRVGIELLRRESGGYLPTEIGLRIAARQLESTIGSGLSARNPLVTDFTSRIDDIDELTAEERTEFSDLVTEVVTSTADLGDQFDIRKFHDAILDNGAVPLALLDGVVAGHVAGHT